MSRDFIDVTAALIVKDEKLLVTRRATHKSHPGKWEFPGGKVEGGETPEVCLAREINEELGVKIQVDAPCLVFEYDYGRPDGKKHRFFSFWCTILDGEPTLRDHDELAWVQLRDLPNFDWIEADKQLVEKLQSEKSPQTA